LAGHERTIQLSTPHGTLGTLKEEEEEEEEEEDLSTPHGTLGTGLSLLGFP